MLICEFVFCILTNIVRYNRYGAEKWMLLLMLLYSLICLYFMKNYNENQWMMYIYLAGSFQGIVGIVENLIKRKKYQKKQHFIKTFEKNNFFILSFDMIEKYTVKELELLKLLNEEYEGPKSGNILIIQKDVKKEKIMMMFFIINSVTTREIIEYCKKNYNEVKTMQNQKKQVVICYF